MFFSSWRPVLLHLNLLFILFAIEAGVAKTNNYSTELFPTPEVLKPNVEFWKSVYAKYSEREVIIHDSWDLNIIYEVVHLDSLFKGVNVSSRIQWKKIEQIKKGYKTILLKLSRRRNLNIVSLRGKEKYVASLFGPGVTRKRLRTAASRIRGQSGLKERFRKGLIRSGLYLDKMREIFRKAGLPDELLVLPHVESSFNYKAYSKLGAAGLWQFTRSTGRAYMKINYNVDERLDPILATRAAARLLKKNYEDLGVWPLAITAYNHGRNGMKKARRKFGTDIGKISRYYRSRSFGFASRNFYAEFLAALHIATNYEKYFGVIEFHEPKNYLAFEIPDYITVGALLKKFDMSLEEFAELNPALRNPVLKSRRRIPKYFQVRVPFKDNFDMEKLYAQISTEFKFDKQVTPDWHKVRAGENLSQIARRYRVSLRELMAANNIRNAHRIYVGQNLQIPDVNRGIRSSIAMVTEEKQTQLAEAVDLTATDKTSVLDVPRTIRVEMPKKGSEVLAAPPSKVTEDKISYVSAKPGMFRDTLLDKSDALRSVEVQQMESQYESVEDVMAMALPDHYVSLTKDMGMRVVRSPKVEFVHDLFRDIEPPENGQIIIEPDETLGHFADWLDVPTYKLRRMNRLSYREPIQVGRSLWLTFEKVTPEEFHRRRIEYHQGIEEDFYRNFTIAGETSYKVKRGDNIWIICNRNFEMPHWLLKKYNANQDLSNLVAGEEIVVPIVEARFPQDIFND